MNEDSVAFVLFNVKGKDLLAIDEFNDFSGEKIAELEKKKLIKQYESLNLKAEPFANVKYYFPYSIPKTAYWNTYLSVEEGGR